MWPIRPDAISVPAVLVPPPRRRGPGGGKMVRGKMVRGGMPSAGAKRRPRRCWSRPRSGGR